MKNRKPIPAASVLVDLYRSGLSLQQIGERYGVSKQTIGRAIKPLVGEFPKGRLSAVGKASLAALRTTHGQTDSPEYRVWCHIKGRCLNANDQDYPDYGGRGIAICDRWLTFENFLLDVGRRPPGTSIDRINNDGNYEPGNCRWVTQRDQLRNMRRTVLVTIDGETKALKDWAEHYGLNYSTLRTLARRGKNPLVELAATYDQDHLHKRRAA